jgi:hypothetical protein
MLKKFIISALVLVFGVQVSRATPPETAPVPDEGMWLPLYLKKLNERDMKNAGMRFTAEDIYNINHSSMKDAVVCLNYGNCTAEIVSNEGLVLTNHHCGYEKIAEHSSVENNYLRDGFWAKTKAEELSNPDFVASILVYMEDETTLINNAVKNIKSEELKDARIGMMKDSIAKAAMKDNKYRAEVKDYFKGNEFYLVVYQDFKDIRLVGAPPSSIGKFGGDVDNWMWPRHTGDFSVFRIYTAPDGSPATYSKDNVPYKPKYFFPVSLKGEKQNDFAMVMGYPGRTNRYLTSYDLEYDRDYANPGMIDAFETQLRVMKKEMDADEAVKIKLASEYASISNTSKYYEGQELMMRHGAGFETKTKQEKAFTAWVNADPKLKEKYGNVLGEIKQLNGQMKTIQPALSYFFSGLFRDNLLLYSFNYFTYTRLTHGGKAKPTKDQLDSVSKAIRPGVEEYFKNNTFAIDKKLLSAQLLDAYNNIPADKRPAVLTKIVADDKKAANPEAAFNNYIEYLAKKSFLLDEAKAKKFLDHPNMKKLQKDPMFMLLDELIAYYRDNLAGVYQSASGQLEDKHKLYMEALREFQPDKTFYPDANSTLRVTYGKILPYVPRDGVFYKYYTTYDGILQKSNPKDPEFVVPQRELDLFAKKEFGRYAQDDTLRINFLANTDITGGNSGSPVLDANGNLIGLAFDGDWEAMIGDLSFNPNTNRTIAVDIRYVLWIMDIYAGAGVLVNEMKIVQ